MTFFFYQKLVHEYSKGYGNTSSAAAAHLVKVRGESRLAEEYEQAIVCNCKVARYCIVSHMV